MSEGDWKGGTTGSSSGRFPANLILQHTPNCVKVGTKTVGSGERRDAKDGNSKPFDDGRGWNSPPMTRGGATAPENYGTETVDDWNCSDTCPVRHLDEQTGQLYSSDHRRANTHGIGAFTMVAALHVSPPGTRTMEELPGSSTMPPLLTT